MVETLEGIALATVSISALLALLVIIKFNKLNQILKVVGIFIIVGAGIDIVSTAFYYKAENNLKFLHIFTFFEFVILSHLFRRLFVELRSKVNILPIVVPATIFIILNSVFIQNIQSLNSYSSILTSILVLGFCIHFFILILDRELDNFPFITLKWFIIGLFLYHSTSLIVMLFGSLILDISREAVSYIWGFRLIIIFATKIILLICFTMLLLMNRNLKT